MRRSHPGTAERPSAPPGWLDEAYRQIDPPLRRYLRASVTGGGEDIVSQVWVEATAASLEFAGGVDDFRRLVFTIARRRLVDHRRRWWQRRVTLMGTVPERPDEQTGDGSGDRAVELVRRLPRAQAEVVFLRVIAGLSASEVAAITGRTPEAVRVMQHRALTALARILADAGER
jgi:RNA polymerase sigma-70 factor, ECF subfamily